MTNIITQWKQGILNPMDFMKKLSVAKKEGSINKITIDHKKDMEGNTKGISKIHLIIGAIILGYIIFKKYV